MLLRIIIILLMIAIIPFEWKAIENHTSNACDPTISDVKTESDLQEILSDSRNKISLVPNAPGDAKPLI